MADPPVTQVGLALLDSDTSLEPELGRCVQGLLPVHVARISSGRDDGVIAGTVIAAPGDGVPATASSAARPARHDLWSGDS